MARRTVRLFVSGRVQGVGYRYWTMDQAALLGLDGWVRNRVDGRVEILAAGEPEAVAALIGAAARGPRAARVEGVETADDADYAPPGFRELPTV